MMRPIYLPSLLEMTPMTRLEAIAMIDNHKNRLTDPVEMLRWTWLRVIINQMTDDTWEKATDRATEVLSR